MRKQDILSKLGAVVLAFAFCSGAGAGPVIWTADGTVAPRTQIETPTQVRTAADPAVELIAFTRPVLSGWHRVAASARQVAPPRTGADRDLYSSCTGVWCSCSYKCHVSPFSGCVRDRTGGSAEPYFSTVLTTGTCPLPCGFAQVCRPGRPRMLGAR